MVFGGRVVVRVYDVVINCLFYWIKNRIDYMKVDDFWVLGNLFIKMML